MFESQILFLQENHAYYHVPSIVTAMDGSILAFCEERWRSQCDDTGECHIVMKKSTDNGQTWGELIHLKYKADEKYHMGSAVTDTITDKVLLMCGGGWLQSKDNGDSWQDWQPIVKTVEGTNGSSTHGSGPGIVLLYGKNRGRIVWPARTIVSSDGYDDLCIPDRRTKCYSTVLYSDDHGATIHSSNYFLQGTGEACLAEPLTGELYFNARAYFDDGSVTPLSARMAEPILSRPPLGISCAKSSRDATPAWCAIPPSCAAGVTSFCSPIRTVLENIENMAWCMSVLMAGKAGQSIRR